MFYPTGFGKDLGEFLLGSADNLRPLIKENSARTGSALVQRQNIAVLHAKKIAVVKGGSK